MHLREREGHREKVCLDCRKQFMRNFNYNLHLEYHKDPEWKFECKICEMKFGASHNLKEHLTTHAKSENYRGKKIS